MTRMLAGVPFGPSLSYDKALLDRAKANIERYFCVVGTVDTMDDVVNTLGKRFGWRRRPIPTLKVMQQQRAEIDGKTRDVIAEHNRLDSELYDWVVRRGDPGTSGHRALTGASTMSCGNPDSLFPIVDITREKPERRGFRSERFSSLATYCTRRADRYLLGVRNNACD